MPTIPATEEVRADASPLDATFDLEPRPECPRPSGPGAAPSAPGTEATSALRAQGATAGPSARGPAAESPENPGASAPARAMRAGSASAWAPRLFKARKALRPILLGAFSLIVFALLWEAASRNKWNVFVRFENVPAPSEVIAAAKVLFENPKFVPHVFNSIRRIFLGFGIASVLAVALGLVIGRFRLVSEFLLPPLEVLRPIPAVAWIPLAILMFPTGEQSMVYITFIGAFFPILLSTIHGVASLDRRLVHASLTFGAGPIDVLREVILPGALPAIFTGLSIGMGTSWFSLVTAEMISGQFGIGYYTWEAYTLQNYPDIVLGMISIGVLGMGSSLLVKGVGRWFTPWFQAGGRA